jgi:hypothetical protein
MSKTMFHDFTVRAIEMVRVETRQSVYTVAFHEDAGRKYVVVRGSGDRENVVVRDSDPRIGSHSMFDLPVADWVGRTMDVAMMKTSEITSATQTPPDVVVAPLAENTTYQVPSPRYMEHRPEMAQVAARGTRPDMNAQAMAAARGVVVGQPAPEPVPYPERHVQYAERICQLLRSLLQRDRMLEDCTPAQRDRLEKALHDALPLLGELRAKLDM